MKKIFIIAAFAAFTFTACNNSENSSSEQSNPEQEALLPVVNQDSIDRVHGHSHEPGGDHSPIVDQDSTDKAHGHKH